jgi:hypothetical protein
MLKTDINYLTNCVFMDEAAFNINMRAPYGHSPSGTPAVVVTPSTRAISYYTWSYFFSGRCKC